MAVQCILCIPLLSVPYPSLNKKFCNHRLARLRFEPLTSTITNLLLLLDYSV